MSNKDVEYSKEKKISNLDLIPVILSGGSGTRLWPLSRESYPKQYLKLNESSNFSLLQNTYLRLIGLDNLRNPIIIANKDQRFMVAEQMREINVSPNSIILEPIGRNTAPAVTLAALKALSQSKDPFLLILSSDHILDNEEIFRKVIKSGLTEAAKGKLVTFGIIPNGPETGYGYIESLEELTEYNTFSRIKNFFEKPDLNQAKRFLKNKNYFWNSGIFLFRASIFLQELERFEPEIKKICTEAYEKGVKDMDFFRVNEEVFSICPNKPIDIAIMEKTSLGSVLNLNAGWDDIGSWKSVWNNSQKDKDGNAFKGKVIIENSKNCYLRSEDRLLVGINLEDIIVIETFDAILISNKESTQNVKRIVEKLNKSGLTEGKNNNKNYRPWGNFSIIEKGITWQVKRLELKPSASISLQLHRKRSEHWIIVSGIAKVEIDENIFILEKNESTYIPIGAKHRLSNNGNIPLILIEIQSGDYLGEDDIERFEDIYGRIDY